MSDIITTYGDNVRIISRDHFLIVQQNNNGNWQDIRFHDSISCDYAHSNAREDAQRLADRIARATP